MPEEGTTIVRRLRQVLGLEHNIVTMLVITVFLGIGEELWTRFIPKYLELLGAGTWVIASYGTLWGVLDANYQYPGGWITDRLGRRKALIFFSLLTIIGYLFFIFGTNWFWLLAGTIFVMAWSSLTSPAIFAIIGDSLPSSKRSIGFGVQSIIKRLPTVIAPALGGIMIGLWGFRNGLRAGLVVSIILAVTAIIIVRKYFRESAPRGKDVTTAKTLWRGMNNNLKRLLFADCLARWAEGIAEVFIVLYAIDYLHITPAQFGFLISIQMLTSIVVYLPVARISDRMNRKPFVMLTFFFFALYPLSIALAGSWWLILLAFIVGGLREIGRMNRRAGGRWEYTTISAD